MTTAQATELLAKLWDAIQRRDEEMIASMFIDDAEWLAPPGNATAVALDYTNHMIGARAIARFLAVHSYKLFTDVDIEILGLWSDGPTVIAEQRMHAVLPDGRPYVNDYVLIFEWRDGRVARVREHMDTRRGHEQVFNT